MKKTLLITLILGVISLSCFSQQFELTPEGLRDAADTSKDFLVIPVDGKTASDLYSMSKRYVNEKMSNPKFAIKSDLDGDYLRYSLYYPTIFSFSKMLVSLKINGAYQIEMRFRDGRVRYNITTLSLTFDEGGNEFYIAASKMKGWAIFDNKGKLLMKNEKQKLEDHFNNEVKMFIDFIQSDGASVNDNW